LIVSSARNKFAHDDPGGELPFLPLGTPIGLVLIELLRARLLHSYVELRLYYCYVCGDYIYYSHFGFPLCCVIARNAHLYQINSACSRQASLVGKPNCSSLFVPYPENLIASSIITRNIKKRKIKYEYIFFQRQFTS
jgi:hypothetical protein